ncbi:MAG TPA: hypothetical protein VLA98_03745 [Solirubrobacteraceae bacterium]|nr:hypothetical protein [Solirubrobacteraceae bacterium]
MPQDPPPAESGARRAEALLRAAEAAAAAASAAGGAVRAEAAQAGAHRGADRGDLHVPGPGAAPAPATTAVQRLLVLAEDLGARVHDARGRLDELEAALARLADQGTGAATAAAPRPPAPAARTPTAADAQLATARLVAVEMALTGADRGEVADVLTRAFGLAPDDPLLEDVFGGRG